MPNTVADTLVFVGKRQNLTTKETTFSFGGRVHTLLRDMMFIRAVYADYVWENVEKILRHEEDPKKWVALKLRIIDQILSDNVVVETSDNKEEMEDNVPYDTSQISVPGNEVFAETVS